jgi:hypothetical protein
VDSDHGRGRVETLHLRAGEVYSRSVLICGLEIPSRLVLGLAVIVDDRDLMTKLTQALAHDVDVLTLTVDERETLLDALADAPEGFETLRDVLENELTWLRAEGIV